MLTYFQNSFTVRQIVSALLRPFIALTLLVGQQEGHPACKKLSGGVLLTNKVNSALHPSGVA